LTHAIIRQESVFNPNIESRAGAKGLMQLMPATAKQEAVKLGIAHDTAWLFSKPEHNVRLGQSYLNRMLSRYDGSLPLAVAAYNAGPGNVDKWLTTIGDPRATGDELEWMEKIPFKETRNYVQRVLESYTIYQNK
jgi:soluble lytic murein transglycosylase